MRWHTFSGFAHILLSPSIIIDNAVRQSSHAFSHHGVPVTTSISEQQRVNEHTRSYSIEFRQLHAEISLSRRFDFSVQPGGISPRLSVRARARMSMNAAVRFGYSRNSLAFTCEIVVRRCWRLFAGGKSVGEEVACRKGFRRSRAYFIPPLTYVLKICKT